MSVRLTVETAAARLVGSLSRAAGRGGGTTLPGKLLWHLDRDAVTELARRLPDGCAMISATNGKTTTTAMAAAVLGRSRALAWNNSGANLASGVTSTLLAARDAELGLLEVDEFALPEVLAAVRPRVVALGNLFRDQLDRYGELEHIAERWRATVGVLPADVRVVAIGDDPLVADAVSDHAAVVRYGVDDPRVARPSLQHAADSTYCVRCGAPYEYAAAYVGHLGDYRCARCDNARPVLDIVARHVDLQGLDAAVFTLETPHGSRRVRVPLPGLYNVYNALAAAALCLELGASLDDVVDGLERFSAAFGRLERIAVDGRDVLLLLIKNPAGANEAVRTLDDGGIPPTLVVALNDAIADGRDISWIWDVDFEPLLEHAQRIVVTGDRAAELALRFTYAGLPEDRLEVIDAPAAALDRGLALAGDGGRLAVLPTYTAMLALRAVLTERGYVRPYWEVER